LTSHIWRNCGFFGAKCGTFDSDGNAEPRLRVIVPKAATNADYRNASAVEFCADGEQNGPKPRQSNRGNWQKSLRISDFVAFGISLGSGLRRISFSAGKFFILVKF
jgi:hypothetical protein